MYVGAGQGRVETKEHLPCEGEGRLRMRSTIWNPSLVARKCIEEALDNLLDCHIEGQETCTFGWINIGDGKVVLVNDGVTIRANECTDDGVNAIEAAFGYFRSGSHFGGDHMTVGQNGLGIKLTNVLSKEFDVQLNDMDQETVGFRWREGMTKVETIETSEDLLPGCIKVSFMLDEEAVGPFGQVEDYVPWVIKKLLESNLSMSMSFSVNNQDIVPIDIPGYLRLFHDGDVVKICEGENEVFAMLVDTEGQMISFVNRHRTVDDGLHVSAFLKAFGKGKKPVTYGKVISERALIYIHSEVVNPEFNGQAKDRLSGGKLAKFVIRNDEDVTEFAAEIEESVEVMGKLTKAVPKQRKAATVKIEKLHDALLAGGGRSSECTLILTEGDSAKTFAVSGMSVVGHDLFGAYPLRGKALNVTECDEERILSNAEWKAVLQILGLTLGTDGEAAKATMRYGKVLVLADADLDGIHICGLILNFFATQFPRLLSGGMLQLFRTPVVKAKDASGTVKEFFSINEYNQATLEGPYSAVHYYKGLGSSSREEARCYFERYDELMHTVEFREGTSADNEMLQAMFARDSADKRKELIKSHLNR